MLGKYRSLKSSNDLCRALDILEKKRFFVPSVASLNDPLEGRGLRISIPGYAGMSIAINAGELLNPIKDSLNRFGVLCLTSDCRNPQMWTHYADGFRGMCICLKQSGSFSHAKHVTYQETAIDPNPKRLTDSQAELDFMLTKALSIKQSGWAYENEYRIIKKRDGQNSLEYYEFEKDDLCAVIIGHCASQEISGLIQGVCERLHIPLYRTFIHEIDNRVNILPYDFEIQHSGATISEQLSSYYAAKPLKPFSELELL